jgi:LuxR family maltose regulon positive regulatory protein
LIAILALQALVCANRAREDDAVAALTQALRLAEPERYIRTFVDMGAPMQRLLQLALSRGIATAYVRELLAHFATPPTDAAGAVVDPLTERELEVLRLLPTSLSTVEIAEQLVVAPSTVRTHIKSIYSKLQVNRRADAVKRGEELRLMEQQD